MVPRGASFVFDARHRIETLDDSSFHCLWWCLVTAALCWAGERALAPTRTPPWQLHSLSILRRPAEQVALGGLQTEKWPHDTHRTVLLCPRAVETRDFWRVARMRGHHHGRVVGCGCSHGFVELCGRNCGGDPDQSECIDEQDVADIVPRFLKGSSRWFPQERLQPLLLQSQEEICGSDAAAHRETHRWRSYASGCEKRWRRSRTPSRNTSRSVSPNGTWTYLCFGLCKSLSRW